MSSGGGYSGWRTNSRKRECCHCGVRRPTPTYCFHNQGLWTRSRGRTRRMMGGCPIPHLVTRQTTLSSLGRMSATSPCRGTSAYDLTSSKAQNQLKRISTTSSIFPVPPSNMAMLMAEDLRVVPVFSPTITHPFAPIPPKRIRSPPNRTCSTVD
jgi:hypothetical protein